MISMSQALPLLRLKLSLPRVLPCQLKISNLPCHHDGKYSEFF